MRTVPAMQKSITGLIFVIAFLFYAPSNLVSIPVYAFPADETLAVSFIDVGQGDSILVEFPEGTVMLVDAGTAEYGDDVVGYLHQRDVDYIDILVATHPHADHIGGMIDVINEFPIGKVWDSGYVHGSNTQANFLQAVQDNNIRFGSPRAGYTETIGDVNVEVLAPPEVLLSGTDSDANNSSIVLYISYNEISFLLTGDMESEERNTVSDWPDCTVLKVAHHGSSDGTSLSFLQDVTPEVAIVSYGAGNNYGHPHQECRDALDEIGCAVKSTAINGTVVFTTDGYEYEISSNGSHIGVDTGSSNEITGPVGTGSIEGGGNYIGNRNSHVFHRPTCSHLPYPQNRVYFDTREEAIAAGYRPCRICNP